MPEKERRGGVQLNAWGSIWVEEDNWKGLFRLKEGEVWCSTDQNWDHYDSVILQLSMFSVSCVLRFGNALKNVLYVFCVLSQLHVR